MFTNALTDIFTSSYTVADMQNEIITSLEAQGHSTYNWNISYPNDTTVQLDFNATSPPLLLIAIIIIGIAVIAAFLYLIVATAGTAGKVFLGGLGIAIAAAGIIGVLTYFGIKPGKKKNGQA
jgi:hypothetical protein